MFSKRYSLLSVLLLLSVFLPWFGLNIVFAKLTIRGYQLHAASIMFIILGVAGVVASFLKHRRFRAFVETVIGALAFIMIWVSDSVFHGEIANKVNSLVGGAGSLFGSSAPSINSSQIASMVTSTDFGFYVALIASLALAGFGLQSVSAFKTEQLLPDKWNIDLIRGNVQNLSQGFTETASTLQSQLQTQAKKIDWSKWNLRGVRGRALLGGLAVLVAYFVGMIWYNSTHSLNATLHTLVRGIQAKNVSEVDSALSLSAVPSTSLNGFVDYYNQNQSALQGLLTPLSSQSSGNSQSAFSTLFAGSSTSVTSVKHNILGYVSYKIVIPSVQVSLSGPSNSKPNFTLNGKTLPSTMNLLPAVYDVTATINTPLGPVTEKKQIDTTSGGSVKQQFGFSSDMLNVQSQDLPESGKVVLSIQGHDIPSDSSSSGSGSNNLQTTIGPIPNAQTATVVATISEPWGNYVESGTDQSGQVQIIRSIT